MLIKDNHIKAAGGITAAVKGARAHVPHTMKVEVEASTLPQVDEALAAGADIILLDNMTTRRRCGRPWFGSAGGPFRRHPAG